MYYIDKFLPENINHGRLLTVPEVAEYLQIGRSTVYLLFKQGELGCIHIGRTIRVHPEQLISFIKSRCGKPSNKWNGENMVLPTLDDSE